ncbi:MAG: hypothetical protein L0Y64_21495 [Myxococcaceae bacterium]|nr:hypothetical protein [Myxococcaceae bacterium]
MARTETDWGARVGDVQDFISRYMKGGQGGGISGEEAIRHYDTIFNHLKPAEFEAAAQAAFARMSPEQCEQLARLLQQRARQQEYNFPELSEANAEQFRDAKQLALIVCSLESKERGIFRDMLVSGGDQGGMGDLAKEKGPAIRVPLIKAAIGGIAAMALNTLIRTRGTPEGRPSEQV